MDMFDRVINKGEALSMENPKRLSFSSNLRGHRNMTTIDQQITQGVTPDFQSGNTFQNGQWGTLNRKTGVFTPGEISHPNAPPNDSYFAYDELVRNLAKEYGMDPLNAQALMWVGKKYRETGEISAPMIQEVNNMIERTSRLTGRSPEEVFKKGFAYKDPKTAIPLYGFLGAAGAGAAAAAAGGRKGNERRQ